MSLIRENLQSLRSDIPHDVTVVAVSKTKPISIINEAFEAGQRVFGENRVQELVDKQPLLPDEIEWHMIGHLQTNKVKAIVPFVHLIHSVDSQKLLNAIQKEARKVNRKVQVLLQIHIAEEEHKYGFTFQEASSLFYDGYVEQQSHVDVLGLMGMATFTNDEKQIQKEFQSLNELYDELKDRYNLQYLSMGMSGDYQLAIEAGSNMIRVGSLLFGSR